MARQNQFHAVKEFVIHADDPHVARFLRNNPPARYKLVGAVKDFAFISIKENEQKEMMYCFSQHKNKPRFSPTYFNERCKQALTQFLGSYTTEKQTFAPELIQQMHERNQQFFNDDDPRVFIRWFLNANHVLICGEKDVVFSKLRYIRNSLENVGSMPSSSGNHFPQRRIVTASIPAQDIQVAMFLKNSEWHLNRLKAKVEILGKVTIKVKDKHDVEYQISTEAKNNSFKESVFQHKCKTSLSDFLEGYKTEKQTFNESTLSEAKSKYPSFFEDQTASERKDLFVKWYPTQVVICGEKQRVEDKLKELTEIVDCLSGSSTIGSAKKFVKIAEDKNVGMFVKRSPKNKAMLDNLLKSFATVSIQENNDRQMEYHCQPSSGMAQSSFEQLCDSVISKFENEYKTEKVTFAPGTIAKTKVDASFFYTNNKEFFERWFKENDHVILSGPKEVVQERLEEITNIFGQPATSTKYGETDTYEVPVSAEEKSIVIFIKRSSKRSKELGEILGPMSTVEIKQNGDDLVFECSTDLDMPNFEDHFKILLAKHLEKYDSTKVYCDAEVLDKVIKKKHKCFDTSQCDKDLIYVHWYRNAKSPHVVIIGLKHEVESKKKEVEKVLDQFKINKGEDGGDEDLNENCAKHKCQLLIKCDILKKTNKTFSGKVRISCFPTDEKILFSGSAENIDEAKNYIETLKEQLCVKTPELPHPKLMFLKEALTKNTLYAEEIIQKTFDHYHVKGVITFDSELKMSALSESHFKSGCDALDTITHSLEKGIPATLPLSAFSGNKWKEFIKRSISLHKLCVVVEKETIHILGFDKSQLELAAKDLDKLIDNILENSAVFKCKPSQAKMIVERLTSDHRYPVSVTMKMVSNGVDVSGPTTDVQQVLSKLGNIPWQEATLSFTASNLSTYLDKMDWKSALNHISKEYCTVVETSLRSTSQTKSASDNQAQETSTSSITGWLSGLKKQFFTSHEADTFYGTVNVKVILGDITKQTTDAIVNGCVSTFDLKQGLLSPHVLRCAGDQMQKEINSNVISKSCRITGGYKLPCKHVIHIVTPKAEDKLLSRIKTALKVAEIFKCSSIAFPTLGSGNIGMPVDVVAKSMAKAFEEFAAGDPKFVKLIKLVVFNDPTVLKTCTQAIMDQIAEKGKLQPQLNAADILAKRIEKMNLSLETVDVKLTTDKQGNLKDALDYIQKHMKSKQYSIPDGLEMNDDGLIDIVDEAIKYNAALGIRKTKIDLQDPIHNVLLRDFLSSTFADLKEGNILAQNCLWQYVMCNATVDMPTLKNLKLEKEFKKNSKSSFDMQLYGLKTLVDFQNMRIQIGQEYCKLNRLTLHGELPREWDKRLDKLKTVLSDSSSEYQRVLHKFQESRPIYKTIVKIERVQNRDLYHQFKIKEAEVQKSMSNQQNVAVRELFHGTSTADAEKIIREGFDRSFAGKNAVAYGRGVYFAVSASYSAKYCVANTSGCKTMFLAKVITGEYSKGDSTMKTPPERNSERKFDSTVNDVTNPSIFVVYKDSSVYPSHLITFA